MSDEEDLFADEDEKTEEQLAKEKKEKEELVKLTEEKRLKNIEKKKKDKSTITWKINPSESGKDHLDALYSKIMKEAAFKGLTWGVKFETKPLAFGLYTLTCVCTILDKDVNMNDVEDKIDAIEGVNSHEILNWNKL